MLKNEDFPGRCVEMWSKHVNEITIVVVPEIIILMDDNATCT